MLSYFPFYFKADP